MAEEINDDLVNLTECCGAFREAVATHLQGDPALTQKAMESMTEEEMEKLQEMAQELAGHTLNASVGSISKEFVDLTIKSAEITVDLAGRVMDISELSQFVPEDLKSEEGAKQLEENKAPKFAALCRQSL